MFLELHIRTISEDSCDTEV